MESVMLSISIMMRFAVNDEARNWVSFITIFNSVSAECCSSVNFHKSIHISQLIDLPPSNILS